MLLVLWFLTISTYTAAITGGEISEPAFKLRLTRSGLNYVNEVASDILNQELGSLQIDNIDMNGTAVSNIRVRYFEPPAYSYNLLPPSTVAWGFSDADIELSGRIRACKRVVINVCKTLDFVAGAEAVGLHLSVSLGRHANNTEKPAIVSVDCVASIRQLELRVRGGIVGWIINLFRHQVARKMKPKVEKALCRQAKKFILNRVNAKLASFPVRVDIGRSFRLDYGLVSDPLITTEYIEVALKGLVSQTNSSDSLSPYTPSPMATTTGTRMLYAWASEKMLNDLLYFAHISNLTQLRLSEKAPALSSFLKLQCTNTGKCLGAKLPEVANMFPRRVETAELFVTTTSAPLVRINGNETASLTVHGIIDLYVMVPSDNGGPSEKKSIALSAVNLIAHLCVSVENMSLVGHVNVTHLSVTVLESRLDFFTVMMFEVGLSSIMARAIEKSVNERFRTGIPIPVTKGVDLVNPKITLLERTVQVESDLLYMRG